ncbi:MAG: DUF4178 domain-containing protein [Gammaproteobacteria bacterium SHHR-1]|uniref:DUF4178 domain-containing protein n=1 Tax=Magnetovirga frankeli TaxID=947516 RepID=UPI001293F8A9|nr:DUF4178 domain-containing protein [gamma proteobacterium SS-5]
MARAQPTPLFQEQGKQLNCPSCGAPLPKTYSGSRLVACDNCRSVLLLGKKGVDPLGKQAELADYPSLFELGRQYRYGDLLLVPAGMLRFSYGRGSWDEWWCQTDRPDGVWISVDEGDFVMEQAQRNLALPALEEIRRRGILELFNARWVATEFGRAEYQGMAGALPEVVKPGRTFDYVHLSAPGRQLITLEYDDPAAAPGVFLGEWMDPFRIEAL